jgi:hypothetical protein
LGLGDVLHEASMTPITRAAINAEKRGQATTGNFMAGF